MTNKEMIGKYFDDGNGIIAIKGIYNRYIYDYVSCEIDENGNVFETSDDGLITPQELRHFTEI